MMDCGLKRTAWRWMVRLKMMYESWIEEYCMEMDVMMEDDI